MNTTVYCNIKVVIDEHNNVVAKECRQCKEIKSLNNFHKKSVRGIGGVWHICKKCRNKTNILRIRPIDVVIIGGKKHKVKECSKCHELKKLEEYRDSRHKGSIGGKVSICQDCEKKWQKKYRKNNKVRVSIAKQKSYSKKKDDYIERVMNNYHQDPEKVKKRSRKYYYDNREERLAGVKTYAKENPQKTLVWRQNYKAKKRHLPNSLTKIDLKQIYEYFNSSCALTEEKENNHFDHFIPISIGHGGTYKGNMIILSETLNVSKSNSNPFEWIEREENIHLKDRFNEVVEYLAKLNKLSNEEFVSFVNWCFQNQRILDEVKRDKRHSMQIWRESMI